MPREHPGITAESSDANPGDPYDFGDPDLPYWLASSRVRGIGPARFHLLLERFGSAEHVWRSEPDDWLAAGLDPFTAASFTEETAAHRTRGRAGGPVAATDRCLALERFRLSTATQRDPFAAAGTLRAGKDATCRQPGVSYRGNTPGDGLWASGDAADHDRAGQAALYHCEWPGARCRLLRPCCRPRCWRANRGRTRDGSRYRLSTRECAVIGTPHRERRSRHMLSHPELRRTPAISPHAIS